jgi:hypothetical protein
VVVVVELCGGGAGCCIDELSSEEVVVVVEEGWPAHPAKVMRVVPITHKRIVFFMVLGGRMPGYRTFG